MKRNWVTYKIYNTVNLYNYVLPKLFLKGEREQQKHKSSDIFNLVWWLFRQSLSLLSNSFIKMESKAAWFFCYSQLCSQLMYQNAYHYLPQLKLALHYLPMPFSAQTVLTAHQYLFVAEWWVWANSWARKNCRHDGAGQEVAIVQAGPVHMHAVSHGLVGYAWSKAGIRKSHFSQWTWKVNMTSGQEYLLPKYFVSI